jgi:flavin-dependent dehydrogenase
VRRSTLDPWLQDAAEAAGADLRDRHRVVDVVRDGDRISGVVVQNGSKRETIHAGLVVGADGPHSTIAKLAGAEEYLGVDGTRGGYFMYFPAPDRWEYPWDATLEHRGDEVRYVFRADGDLVILIAGTDREQAESWGKDWREKTRAMYRTSPITRALSEGKDPVGKGCGLVKMRFFYRRPVGPGFALVGDAGHFKDFVTGQGMTDAFLDAERLARAIFDGREAAFTRYWYERDVETMPLHFDAIRQGKVGYNDAFMRWVFSKLGKNPDIMARMPGVFERTRTPYDLVPFGIMLSWMGSALVRGRFDVLKGFLAAGKTMGEEQKEIASRKKLLDAAPPSSRPPQASFVRRGRRTRRRVPVAPRPELPLGSQPSARPAP